MDDQIVPISAQYADGADVVYYGEYAHGDFTELADVAGFLADQTLRYVFGGNIQCSVFAQGGAFDHKAAFFPGTEFWQDTVGEVLAGSGTLSHRNDSYFQWQEWADVVGGASPGSTRSSFQTTEKKSFPILTGIKQVGWLSPDDPLDGRISVITRAAPRSSVQVDWSVYQVGLLPSGIVRDHYEVEIDTGTQFTSIGQVGWETGDPRDLRLLISSQAPGPFRWFEAQWRVYYKESRQRKIIDSLPIQTVAKQGP